MAIQIKGILDGLTQSKVSGWVNIKGDNLDNDEKPLIIISVNNEIIAKGFATTSRPDVEKLGGLAFGFSLALKKEITHINNLSDINIVAAYKDSKVNLKIYKPIKLALQFKALNQDQQLNFIGRIQDKTNILKILPTNVLAAVNRSTPPQHKLCIITYANDVGAWFPYFYQYYSKLVGEKGIYLVSPKPEVFNNYNLGAIISCADMFYNNEARAQLMSGLATGLQSYYQWTLVCDVDEIIIPHPNSYLDFFQTLSLQKNDVIVSRGFDVIQMNNEADFSFDLPVLEHRHFANPNIALSKPHLAKMPIQYSGGYHYCNYKLALPEQNTGFITLHLKWACQKIRNEVAAIVAKTNYTHEKTADYSIKSVSEQSFESRIKSYLGKKIESLNSPAMQEFEKNYEKNLEFVANRGLWIGQHINAPFLVDLKK